MGFGQSGKKGSLLGEWGGSLLGLHDNGFGRESMSDKKRRFGLVYFIQQDVDGPIKIGFTTNLENRLRNLATGSPFPLRVLVTVPGDEGTEATIHRALAVHRLNLEWYTNSKEVLFLIDHYREVGGFVDPFEVLRLLNAIETIDTGESGSDPDDKQDNEQQEGAH